MLTNNWMWCLHSFSFSKFNAPLLSFGDQPVKRSMYSDSGTHLLSESTDQHCNLLAKYIDWMSFFQQDHSTEAGFRWTDRAAYGLKFDRFLLNLPNFVLYMASLTPVFEPPHSLPAVPIKEQHSHPWTAALTISEEGSVRWTGRERWTLHKWLTI